MSAILCRRLCEAHCPARDLLHVRFTLSLRDVAGLLAERGIIVTYETIRAWVERFDLIARAFDSIHLAWRSRCFSSTLVVRQALNHTRRDNPGVRNVMKIRLGYELIFDPPANADDLDAPHPLYARL